MSNVKKQSMPLGLALLPILFTVSLIAIQLFVFDSFDPQVPLLFGIFLTACIGVIRGWKWRDMESGMFNIVIISLPAFYSVNHQIKQIC